ncbi:MAG: hypothetical protein J6D09_01850 [Clostridia bacterium]|nr:hypothetical protein [Clostridia bacterium]
MGKKKNKKNDNLEISKICTYCENATIIADDENVLCSLHGIVNKEYCCKKFIYDPLKRVPRQMPPMPKLTEEDLLI